MDTTELELGNIGAALARVAMFVSVKRASLLCQDVNFVSAMFYNIDRRHLDDFRLSLKPLQSSISLQCIGEQKQMANTPTEGETKRYQGLDYKNITDS